MITDYNSNAYRISYQGVAMIENALDNPNLIQVSVVSGCTIMVAPQKEYGIGYLPNGEYRSWNLTGYNTRLNRTEAHKIYARLGRETDDAMVLFSVNDYATDGSIGGQNPSEDYYYIRIGSITATDKLEGATLDREITLDYGKLSTPEGQDQDSAGWKELCPNRRRRYVELFSKRSRRYEFNRALYASRRFCALFASDDVGKIV